MEQSTGIKVCKLISREFVIGRYVDNFLTNVALITFTGDPISGDQTARVIPYMHPILPTLVKIIPSEKIIVSEDAPPNLQQSYLELIKHLLEHAQEAMKAEEAMKRKEKDPKKETIDETPEKQ